VQVGRGARGAHDERSRRGLSTARAALQVAWLLARRPEGTRADEVAETLGKSVSTAYNVLASLCEEGVAVRHPGGLYRLAPAFREIVASGPPADPTPPDFSGLADDLLTRTHKRAYVGLVDDGKLHVVAERGQRGMPKLPGLDPDAHDSAHALAMGKVVLSRLRPEAVARYAARGLPAYTRSTITTLPGLLAELERMREHGYAVDREEFDEDFCCVAAPITGERGELRGILGLSASVRAFDTEHDVLASAVVGVAAAAGLEVPA
jgi:DNA-binding IclR family transcriptional regulator